MSTKRDWARGRASGKKKFALYWVPVGPIFAVLADWPLGLLLVPLCWLLAGFLWWIATVEERFLLRTFDRYGEDHPVTSWTTLGQWLRTKMTRSP